MIKFKSDFFDYGYSYGVAIAKTNGSKIFRDIIQLEAKGRNIKPSLKKIINAKLILKGSK